MYLAPPHLQHVPCAASDTLCYAHNLVHFVCLDSTLSWKAIRQRLSGAVVPEILSDLLIKDASSSRWMVAPMLTTKLPGTGGTSTHCPVHRCLEFRV